MEIRIFNDIINFLSNETININKNDEGRIGSALDESTIKNLLKQKFSDYIIDQKKRKMGDIKLLDYDMKTKYIINIKTSKGGKDNCFSKGGIVYALTDLDEEEIPQNMGWKRFHELIQNHKKDIQNKDYWFLCIDKNNGKVIIRGAKQINNWKMNANPNNCLQVDWNKEKKHNAIHRTYNEAYRILYGWAYKSCQKSFENYPEEWKNAILNGKESIC